MDCVILSVQKTPGGYDGGYQDIYMLMRVSSPSENFGFNGADR